LIFDIESYFETQIEYFERVGKRFVEYPSTNDLGTFAFASEEHLNVTDLQLQANIIRLRFNVYANYILGLYFTMTDTYQLTFFPFAAQHFGIFQLSSSLESYKDLNEIVSATTNNLKSMIEYIPIISDDRSNFVLDKTSFDNNDPDDYLYKWKYSEVRNEIQQLFAGEKIRLFADIKRSDKHLTKQFNAFQFNEINLVFRSSNKTINDQLNVALGSSFILSLSHLGQSDIRCNDDFYRITTGSIMLSYCPPKNESSPPACHGFHYMRYQQNRPSLSPYTLWEIELTIDPLGDEPEKMPARKGDPFPKLAKFIDVIDFDVELHCAGKYLRENASICNDGNLGKMYSLL